MRRIALLAATGLLVLCATASAGTPHIVGKASGATGMSIGGLKPIANVTARATVAHPVAFYVRVLATHAQTAEVLWTVSCDKGSLSSSKAKNVSIPSGRLLTLTMPFAGADSCLVIASSVIRKGGSEKLQILAS